MKLTKFLSAFRPIFKRMAGMFNFKSSLDRYADAPWRDDTKSIASDWKVVGDDLKSAIKQQIKNEKQQECQAVSKANRSNKPTTKNSRAM